MSTPRIRGEFGVELAAEEPGMAAKLDHFAQVAGGGALRPGPDDQAGGLEARQVMIVDLIAVPMSLGDRRRAINPMGERAGDDVARLRPEAHRAAEIGLVIATLDRAIAVLPFRDQRDHRMWCRGIELGAVRVRESRLVARVLDDRQLHAQANAEIRDAVLARVTDCLDLAFDAPLAEPARHQDRIHALEAIDAVALNRLGIDVMNGDFA